MRRVFISSSGRSVNETIKSDTIDSINNQFISGKINFDQAKLFLFDFIQQLKPRYAIQFNEDNQKVLKDYWEAEYSARDISAPQAAWSRLSRAVEALGGKSIRSTTKEELQLEINRNLQGNAQRTAVAALNQILKWLGRTTVHLKKVREEIRSLSYVTQDEFESILTEIKNPQLVLLFKTAFATGLRAGELFAITSQDIRGRILRVKGQVDSKGKMHPTKTRQERDSIILSEWLEDVKKWAAISLEEKMKVRNIAHSKVMRKASQKVLGRQLVFHDLRHSFAVALAEREVSLDLIARTLGNSSGVAAKYYAGKVHTSDTVELVLKKT